jgi:hypothetical protein
LKLLPAGYVVTVFPVEASAGGSGMTSEQSVNFDLVKPMMAILDIAALKSLIMESWLLMYDCHWQVVLHKE